MIQAVTVSLDYADFLRETLPHLVQHVDRVVVVTATRDRDTQRVVASVPCAECVFTDAFKRDGATLRKGAAINAGLAVLERRDWILHIDADIAVLNDIPLKRAKLLYGCRRRLVCGREQWTQLQRRALRGKVAEQDLPFTGRMNRTPIGFFQLWHASNWRPYPEASPDASTDDLVFANTFRMREIMRDFEVYHLESRDHELRCNWQGRRSHAFD